MIFQGWRPGDLVTWNLSANGPRMTGHVVKVVRTDSHKLHSVLVRSGQFHVARFTAVQSAKLRPTDPRRLAQWLTHEE